MKDNILYKILRPIITVLVKLFFTPEILGKENIPKVGKVILAGNHTSIFDSLLLISSTKRNIHFLAKDELCHGFKKYFFLHMGIIPVNRKKKSHESLEQAYQCLNNDLVIGIFPEGTTEKEGKLLPFKMGAVKMAKVTDSLIVPFVIKGKYHLFSKSLQIKYLKPIKVTEDLEKENKRLRSIIERG